VLLLSFILKRINSISLFFRVVLSSYIIVIFQEMNKRVNKLNVFNKPRIHHCTCRSRVTSFHLELDRVSKRRTVSADIVRCRTDYFGHRTDLILTNGYTMRIFRPLCWLFQASPFNAVRHQLAMNKRWCFVTARWNKKRQGLLLFNVSASENTWIDATLIQTWQSARPSFYYSLSTKALCNREDVQKWKNVKKELTLLQRANVTSSTIKYETQTNLKFLRADLYLNVLFKYSNV